MQIYKLFLPIFAFPIIISILYSLSEATNNDYIFYSNFLIIFSSYVGMFLYPKRIYSLSKIFFIFIFIFFGVIPLNEEIINNASRGGQINEADIFKTNLIILLGIFSFIVGGFLNIRFFDKFISGLPEINRLNILYFVLFFFIAFLILFKWDFDLYRLFIRGVDREFLKFSRIFDGTTESLIYKFVIRPIPIILLAIYYYVYKKNNILLLIFLTLISVLLVPPTGIARFQAAALYIPFIILFTTIWDKLYMMQLTLLIGVFIIFPFLDKFRNFSFETFSWSLNLKSLASGNFDAYQNFVRVIEIDYITNGRQLLGSILFFIPRSFWPSKPKGSGTTLANELDYDFGNISMPYIAEGYINYGIVGVFLFMLFLGFLLGNLDRVAWIIKRERTKSLFLYYYYFLFGLVFFLMRGDLMNGIAYTSGFTVAFWITVVFLKKFQNLKFKL